MQLIDGAPVYAATDLVGFLACEHLTALERAALAELVPRPDRADAELDIIRKRGFEHEARYLEERRAEGRWVATIERREELDEGSRVRDAAEATTQAMTDGAEVIYQATFFDGTWVGHADFLCRVESPGRPSRFGPYHYEPVDTKLARSVKAGAVLQLCSYVDLLTAVQGVQPQWMHVALGGSARVVERLRVEDFMAYYRAVKARFMAAVGAGAPPPEYPSSLTYPEPVEHCEVCRWRDECQARRRADDHLSLVAGISGRQRKALVARDLGTVTRLAAAPIPFDPPLDGSSAAAIERVREQARIQVEGRLLSAPIHELLLPPPGEPIEPERGLATLPAPNPGDLFFDIEGDPYALNDGVEYLFGVLGDGVFEPIWAFDPAQPGDISSAGEKAAFEVLIDLFMDRLARYPDMHIYHYAHYEPTALKKLMGRHATREAEVDQLLRGGVLIDLHRAVHQGLRASIESYGLKEVEKLYAFRRSIDLRDAGSSIVAFEEWLELSEAERPGSAILERIARYNEDDVRSTAALRQWLEERRGELARRTGQEVPRPAAVSPEAPEQLQESDARVQDVADRLTAGFPADPLSWTNEQRARWLLAQLLPWHRREAKSAYWEFFHRMGLTPDELVEDKAALGRLEVVGRVGEPWRSGRQGKRKWRQTWRYRIPPQEYDIDDRSDLHNPRLRQEKPDAPWKEWKIAGRIIGIDDARATVDISWPAEAEPRHPEAIVPLNIVPDKDLRAGLLRFGTWVAEHGPDGEGPRQAGRDLLLRRPPRCGQAHLAPLRRVGEMDVDAACRLVSCLAQGTLAIQGPPGSGKTYTGAQMIVRLLASGKKVGLSAGGHKVISHFLREVLKAAGESVDVRAGQKISNGVEGVQDPRVRAEDDNAMVRDGLTSGSLNLGAGTPWFWASEMSDDLVDVLFVDEAGQMSLANVLSMAASTRSLVLLGDPQQLAQPLQGWHPPGADQPALGHLLGGEDTMPPYLGLFLERSRRLHPDIGRFTSTAFYEGRMESMPGLERQALNGPQPFAGAGLRHLSAVHIGADSESPEEARLVAAVVRAIVESGSTWIDAEGRERPIRYEDVLVVAPYNAQVGAIERELPEARVGTVDKFQGQEAPISIYSMTTSSPENAPRGMDFLYSRNRLNVATSRARCMAVVVAEPALLRVRARTVKQMRLANALCLFVELAAPSTR